MLKSSTPTDTAGTLARNASQHVSLAARLWPLCLAGQRHEALPVLASFRCRRSGWFASKHTSFAEVQTPSSSSKQSSQRCTAACLHATHNSSSAGGSRGRRGCRRRVLCATAEDGGRRIRGDSGDSCGPNDCCLALLSAASFRDLLWVAEDVRGTREHGSAINTHRATSVRIETNTPHRHRSVLNHSNRVFAHQGVPWHRGIQLYENVVIMVSLPSSPVSAQRLSQPSNARYLQRWQSTNRC